MVFLLAVVALSAPAGETREPNVFYLDEAGAAPLQLRVRHRTALSASAEPRSVLGYLAAEQRVRLLGWHPDRFYVAATIPTGAARGWVRPSDIDQVPPALVAEWRAQLQARQARQARIARHEVAAGMTAAEVLASLGPPLRKERVRSTAGPEERWVYPTYSYVVSQTEHRDAAGQAGYGVSFRQAATGERLVVFRRGRVVERPAAAAPAPR